MKKSIQTMLAAVMLLAISVSCADFSTPVPPTSTLTPCPRPLLEYDLGIWHSEIASGMIEKGSTILANIGETEVDFEIEILPAKSLQDEVIIIKYGNWPESADLGQVWYWLFLTIETESSRYKLDPQAVITAEFKTKPYGEFIYENNNIIGFCEIPWYAVSQYTLSSGQDVSDVKQFLDTWDCSYR